MTRAGLPAEPSDLVNIDDLIDAYYEIKPDPSIASQRVAFGTSGHRGSSLQSSFNEDHILATTQAIVDYRTKTGLGGPLYIGRDTHALSLPAERSAIEVLIANDIETLVDSRDSYVPTPALSHAILRHNKDLAADSPQLADGIVVTPSHNPPADGGFKYNPANGGPADTDATSWIAARANEYIENGLKGVKRIPYNEIDPARIGKYDFREHYVQDLRNVIDLELIKDTKVHIGADPLGGASVDYWSRIAEVYELNLNVVNPEVDPTWSFMTLDWDEKIRMDPSSPSAMASLVAKRHDYDLLTGNDADADRHGIVTPDAGLMNPNHYIAVAVDYLYQNRPNWPTDAAVGKTLVSSMIIDKVTNKLDRKLYEVPVGFKWFVPGLIGGWLAFGGEESAGASFLRKDGTVWTTDKDGMILCLLAAEIIAATGKSPSQRYAELEAEFGASAYTRVDAPATVEQKAKLAALSAESVTATELAGEKIIAKLTRAPGNDAAIGGLKVQTESAWFAARPSGTENVYKLYAESLRGPEHLAQVMAEAKEVVAAALAE